jgi:hypothetical protein
MQASKERDDSRGVRIISDYRDVHAPALEDQFVKATWKETRELTEKTRKIVSAM